MEIIAEVKQRYHLYYIIPGGASHGDDQGIINFWEQLVGREHVIRLDSPEDTSECIALTIGINEGVISMNDGVAHLQKRGIVSRTIERVTKALTSLMPGGAPANPNRSRHL